MLNKNAWGTFVFSARTSGRQFDDDQNLFLLHSFFRFDIYAEHDFGHHVQVYGMFDNITNRVIEVGRTPSLTLAQPRVAALSTVIAWKRTAGRCRSRRCFPTTPASV